MLTEKLQKAVSFCKENVLFCVITAFLVGFFMTLILLKDYLDNDTEIVIKDPSVSEPSGDGVVDLAGAVSRPGVYELPEGSRIGDLLALGEGIVSEASASWVARNLNLSRPLEDAQKVYVPFEWDLETENELLLIPLVGEKDSRQIGQDDYSVGEIDYREENKSDEEAKEDREGDISVNTASAEEPDELPGIGPKYAERIINNRPYSTYEEFESNSELPKSTAEKIKDLISF
jgi:competence protein ComEA